MLGFGYLVVILRDSGGKPSTHLDLQLRHNKSISSRKKRSRLKRTSSPERRSNQSHLFLLLPGVHVRSPLHLKTGWHCYMSTSSEIGGAGRSG